MQNLRFRLATAAAAIAVTVASFVPAQAIQMPAAPSVSSGSAMTDVTDVQYRRHWDERRNRHQSFNRHGSRDGYYNGHRGYRDRRPGYRYHNGMWFPLAAFGAGALIGGAIASDNGPRGGSHSSWCESRYRSYRASDNTYVASGGVRRTCVSPN